ncbi:AmmeMemoRadiSam system radical SAM enzyme [Candidatus Woesearchaeota archaeon]|jgi:pyruvate formate lyase activating enzyme|nr:AmmeMemoRadiSam system radical SAM enzyme [Candidatus Woesearchaeota archaeon]
MKECMLYEQLIDKNVKCNACSHRCIITDGKRGICGVRKNIKGKLYSLVYGKAVGLAVDPVEKKPLFHFLPGKEVLSFGTVGCNFRCEFCQNSDMSQAPREQGEEAISGKEITGKEIVDYAVKNKIPMIAYTYNEPAVFLEYAHDTAKLAKKKGIKNIYVTNGYETKEALELMKPYIDAMNIDLKSFNDDFYKKTCGARLEPVLETIKLAKKMNFWIEITTLIIPDENDSEKELTQIAEFIASIDKSIPWHISRFFPMYKMQNKNPTSEEKLKQAYEIGKKAGLKYVYVGNIILEGKENTYCPICDNIAIERSKYELGKVNIKESRCIKCKRKISGIFI